MNIQNFKGIKNLEVNFGKQTDMLGANATGKSTIFDAFTWLITGKDSRDRADFEIKPLDSANNPTHMVESIVELETDTIQLKKIFKEKWTKKRGQEEQEFSGHETEYFVDNVPVKKKEYEDKIRSETSSEEIFKILSNPLYFSEVLDWKKRRELLFTLANVPDDSEIIKSHKKFDLFKNEKNIDELKAKIKYGKSKLVKEKETIPARIDELQKTIIQENIQPYIEEKNTLEKELEEIEKELNTDTASEKEKELYQQLSQLRKKQIEENSAFQKTENEKIKTLRFQISEIEKELSEIENEKYKLQINAREFEKKLLEEEVLRELRKEYAETQKKQVEILPDKTCPACNQKIPVELQVKEADNIKKHQLKEINEKGMKLKTEIADAKLQLEKLKIEIEEIEKREQILKSKAKEFEEKTQLKSFEKTDLTETEKEIKIIEKQLNGLVVQDKTAIKLKREKIKNKLADVDISILKIQTQETTKKRIKELYTLEKQIAAQIIELEQQEFLTEEFTRFKVSLIEKSINEKFKIVSFKLFSEQINGGLQEVCEVLLNGVPFKQVNTAGRTQAGIDIINTLKTFYNVKIPVFIDNRESIVHIPENDLQIINLIVAENEKELKIIKEE